MPPKKQNKQKKPLMKKPLMKKTKLKSLEKGVNVHVNIDNSRKTTARRTPSKAVNIQPMINFPTSQPTRIQYLEPKQQFNNADLTNKLDAFQKQFNSYIENSKKESVPETKGEPFKKDLPFSEATSNQFGFDESK